MTAIGQVPAIAVEYRQPLRDVGIVTTEELLDRGGFHDDRARLVAQTGFDEQLLLQWIYRADLERITGIAVKYADLVARCDVCTIQELAEADPAQLWAAMKQVNDIHNLVKLFPKEADVQNWVAEAAILPVRVTFTSEETDAARLALTNATFVSITRPDVVEEPGELPSVEVDSNGDEVTSTVLGLSALLGLEPAPAQRMAALGIRTTDDLLARAGAYEQRHNLASEGDFDELLLTSWIHKADLMRVRGLKSSQTDLLLRAGVVSVPALAYEEPAQLYARLQMINEQQLEPAELPGEQLLSDWIMTARQLPQVVTYPPTEVF